MGLPNAQVRKKSGMYSVIVHLSFSSSDGGCLTISSSIKHSRDHVL